MNKLIQFLVLLIILHGTSLAGEYWQHKQKLPPKPEIGRHDAVLKNIVYVRILPGIENYKRFFEYIKSKNIDIIKNLLPSEASSFMNDKKRDKIQKTDYNRLLKARDELNKTFVLEYKSAVEPELFCSKILSGCTFAECAEPYYLPELQSEYYPNDTLVQYQDMLKTIEAFKAWDVYKGDSNIVIAISDAGTYQDHEDLKNSIWINKNEIPQNNIDDDGNGFIDDYRGYNFTYADDTTEYGNTMNVSQDHGTRVAGVSSATSDNEIGLAGVGFRSKFFPLKTMITWTWDMPYQYESIIYAAMMGFDVVNCSWGGFSYSCIQESVIDYAFASGTSVVAAAGNHGNITPFYPAAYPEVLSVGVTVPRDFVHDMSGRGHYLDIFAPGQGARTTDNSGGYGTFCCTSGSAPIASGAVALVLGKYPYLTPAQANEFVRISNDNIDWLNDTKAGLIPGRLNLYKAMSTDPFEYPSLRPLKLHKFNTEGEEVQRFAPGDTLNLSVDLKNYLGDPVSPVVTMRKVMDSTNLFTIIDSTAQLTKENDNTTDTDYVIDNVSVVINNITDDKPYLRFDILDGDFDDFFLIHLFDSKSFTTFKNERLSVTMADNGKIGYFNPPFNTEGNGLIYKPFCNLLYDNGIILVENNTHVIDNVRNGDYDIDNHFKTVKQFTGKNQNIGIINDENAPPVDIINSEITTSIFLPEDQPFFRLDISVKNNSKRNFNDLTAAYMLDWDMGTDPDSNMFIDYTDLVRTNIDNNAAASAAIGNGQSPYAGVMVFSDDPYGDVQLSGFDAELTWDDDGFSKAEKKDILRSGVDIAEDEMMDIVQLAGMRFLGYTKPDSSRNFSICFCFGKDPEELSKLFRECYNSRITAKKENAENEEFLLKPNPASGMVNLIYPAGFGLQQIAVYDILANNCLGNDNIVFISEGNARLNVSNLSPGRYMIVLKSKNNIRTLPLTVL